MTYVPRCLAGGLHRVSQGRKRTKLNVSNLWLSGQRASWQRKRIKLRMYNRCYFMFFLPVHGSPVVHLLSPWTTPRQTMDWSARCCWFIDNQPWTTHDLIYGNPWTHSTNMYIYPWTYMHRRQSWVSMVFRIGPWLLVHAQLWTRPWTCPWNAQTAGLCWFTVVHWICLVHGKL